MKKTKLILFALAGITLFSACQSLPNDYEFFLENQGAPVELSARPDKENINGYFPDTIYIKTLTQTYSFNYEFCLYEGLIYFKEKGTSKENWKLYLGTGYPFSEKKKFKAAKKIVEICADADVLYAFSADGKLYRSYLKQITSYPAFAWVDYFGWPIKHQLYQTTAVSSKLGWCVGSSRKDVEYYEDIYGNQHNYGPLGVESIVFLLNDGKTLRYSDPACPPDFSHSFRNPDDESFSAENISESASTIFLIGKDGRMYTRLVDYNTVGSDPMLYDYSYEEVHSDIPGYDEASNTTPWALPNEPWKLQPSLPNGSRPSKYITILQTGKGNAARELRVAGFNEKNVIGYFYKNLNDPEWKFNKADLHISYEDLLGKKVEEKAPVLLKNYTGGVWKNGEKQDLSCKVTGFSFSEGPCTLTISDSEKAFNVELYYSEVWNQFLRLEPGLKDESIKYFGTAIFSDEELKAFNNQVINEIFSDNNKVIHNYYIEAFNNFFLLKFDTSENSYMFYLTEDGEIKINPWIDRNIAVRTEVLEDRFFTEFRRPKKIKKDLKKQIKITKSKSNSSATIDTLYTTAEATVSILFRDKLIPKAEIIRHYSGSITGINKEYYNNELDFLKYYKKHIKNFGKLNYQVFEYNAGVILNDFGFQNRTMLDCNFSVNPEVHLIDFSSFYSGICLKDSEGFYLCSFKNLKKMNNCYRDFRTDGKSKAKLKVTYISNDESQQSKFKAKLMWDGKILSIRKK